MLDCLLNEAQLGYREEVREFVRSIPRDLILAMDREEVRFPREFLREAGSRHLLGARHPERWGGRGMNWVTTCMAAEETGVLSYILACIFGTGPDLVCDAIVQHGTDEQRARWVPPVLAGEMCAAECLTEPRGGSDFFGSTTFAEHRGDHFILNGQKRFIVGAEGADYFLVYARTDPDPNAHPHHRLTCFIVERGPGVEVEYLYGLMGCRGGGTGRLVFRDVVVPTENALGGVGGAYPVFNTMMIPERLGTAAMTIGAARPALEIATAYTTRRKAFGTTINHFEGVSFQVAEAAMLLDAARAMVHTTAQAVDRGADPALVRRLVSETKKFVADSCQKVAHNSMQVVGGIGYTNVFSIERIVRDLRLASIWTGTSEIMSTIIAHEWYREYCASTATGRQERDSEADAENAFAPGEKIYE